MLKKLAPLLAAAVLLPACAGDTREKQSDSGANQPGTTIKVTIYGWSMHDIPLLVGIEKGFFSEQGLNVGAISFDSGAAGTTAVLSGDVDLVTTTPLNQSIASANNPDSNSSLVQVYAFEKAGSWVLLAGKGVNLAAPSDPTAKIKALKGKVIGVPAIGSEGQLVTKAMLEHAGLDSEKDVQYVAVGLAAGAIAQFKAGQIDAIVAVEPVARILINTAGGSVVYDMAVDDDVELLKAWNQGTYWGRPSTATQKADAFKKFQAGMDKAIAFVIDPKNTPEVAELWGAKLPAFDKAELVKVLEKNRDVYTTEVDCKAYSSGVDLAVNLGLVQTAQKKACRDTVWTESNQKVVE